jgi:hypothetical protein
LATIDEQQKKKRVFDADGIEIITINSLPAEDYAEFHVWLLYEDVFDIDALHGYLSRYINEELPQILITKGECPMPLGEMAGLKRKLNENGFVCEDVKLSRINKERFKWNFERANGLLDRIYKWTVATTGIAHPRAINLDPVYIPCKVKENDE